MKTPREKYLNDPSYANLVNTLVGFINDCHYTPSEIREASILASILYEENRINKTCIIEENIKIIESLESIGSWINKRKEQENEKE